MVSVAWQLALLCSSLAAAPAEGSLLAYRGSVYLIQDDQPGEALKTFELTLLVTAADESGVALRWLLDERGRGHWPWPERFGSWRFDAQGALAGGSGPALLFDYGSGTSPIPLAPVQLAAPQPLAQGAQWEADGLQFEVATAEEVAGVACWQVLATNNYGLQRCTWINQASGWVVGCNQRVFLNMGTEHEVRWELTGSETLPAERFEPLAQAFEQLCDARQALERPAQSEERGLSAADQAALVAHLPSIAELAAGGPLLRLVNEAQRDVGIQGERAESVAALAEQFVGQPAPDFALEGLDRAALATADLAGQVTVLHFWEYRDSPLEQPYGQVGYLEFLFQKRKAAGVRVVGVAVDARLADEEERGAAVAGVRGLRNFMRLEYPILLDAGDVLQQFGDPRRLGAELPLVVVIDKDGRIVHYHTGYYEVDNQVGLTELSAVVEEALK